MFPSGVTITRLHKESSRALTLHLIRISHFNDIKLYNHNEGDGKIYSAPYIRRSAAV